MTEQAQLSPQNVPDSVIQDLVKELRAINDDQDATTITCACGGHNKTLRQLIADVEQRTPEGIELIRVHLEIQKRLETFRNKRPWWKFWQ